MVYFKRPMLFQLWTALWATVFVSNFELKFSNVILVTQKEAEQDWWSGRKWMTNGLMNECMHECVGDKAELVCGKWMHLMN